jgi:hypothetical protein
VHQTVIVNYDAIVATVKPSSASGGGPSRHAVTIRPPTPVCAAIRPSDFLTLNHNFSIRKD